MRSYKKWSKEDRQKSLRLTNRAKSLGLLKPKSKCQRCGQDKGIIHWHNENYDITLSILGNAFDIEKRDYLTDDEVEMCETALETLCWRCHMMHHSIYRAPEQVRKYFEEIQNGKQYPPVYKHDFGILRREHNVY